MGAWDTAKHEHVDLAFCSHLVRVFQVVHQQDLAIRQRRNTSCAVHPLFKSQGI